MLDFDELLRQIPRLIGRLISFDAFAVYLLEERRGELRMAYAVGYPEPERAIKLRPGVGPGRRRGRRASRRCSSTT